MSLTTAEGRERFELAIGDYQRGRLAGSNPKVATLVQRQDGTYSIQIGVETQPPKPQNAEKVVGVDLGRTDIAHPKDSVPLAQTENKPAPFALAGRSP